MAEGFLLDIGLAVAEPSFAYASIIELSITWFAPVHHEIMEIQQCFLQLSVSCPQVFAIQALSFNLLSLFLLMYWHRYFTMTFCMISYLLLCTCQKWRNKDVQSINVQVIHRAGETVFLPSEMTTQEAENASICPISMLLYRLYLRVYKSAEIFYFVLK